ncbi:hypothetical protein C7H19_05730 [Aphanothece hegewaldii CCALA 016]|uniref:Uncharacterized protein n=1 Tax=Aphanothece hegewaldii CCALA 016 TaxID=2107694 RepID=A0A2T1M1E2_9CHRO|nr:hypothetical protein [Aphanothece hegewaldii]PSF38484.1 hypothetical protein C7H19_05730 [Aphanothece hegewaldii CCALA 016]
MTQFIDPLKQQTNNDELILHKSFEDDAWLDSELSQLDEYEPYDWGNLDPLTLGKAVMYIPEVGFIIEGD